MSLVTVLDEPSVEEISSLRLELRSPHAVSPATIDRFAAGTASFPERRAVTRHLFDGCQDCGRHLRRHWSGDQEPPAKEAYDQVFDRVLQRLWPVPEG